MSRLLSVIRRLFVRTPTITLSHYADTYISARGLSLVVDMPGFHGVYLLDDYDDVYPMVEARLALLHAA